MMSNDYSCTFDAVYKKRLVISKGNRIQDLHYLLGWDKLLETLVQ